MNNDEKREILKNSILSKIRSGQTKMRPRWYFVLRAILFIVLIVVAALALFYLTSFIFFVLRYTGILFVPAFGFYGTVVFLESLPWPLIFAAVIFLILIEILLERYSFAYRRPLVYSIAGIIILVIIGGFILSRTGLHQKLFCRDKDWGLPVAGFLYRGYALKELKNIHTGVVTATTTGGFQIANRRGESITVVVPPNAAFPPDVDFGIGDRMVIVGDRNDGSVQAFGARRVESSAREMPCLPGW